jgi:hypothetical protein
MKNNDYIDRAKAHIASAEQLLRDTDKAYDPKTTFLHQRSALAHLRSSHYMIFSAMAELDRVILE